MKVGFYGHVRQYHNLKDEIDRVGKEQGGGDVERNENPSRVHSLPTAEVVGDSIVDQVNLGAAFGVYAATFRVSVIVADKVVDQGHDPGMPSHPAQV